MGNYLVTGGAGFFGSILKSQLLAEGHHVISIDLAPEKKCHDNLTAFQGDINDDELMNKVFSQWKLDGIFHCAALLAHVKKDLPRLWKSNVDGTRNTLAFAERFGIRSIVFLSTNCLWARNMEQPVLETEEPAPVEVYGRSKWAAEKILLDSKKTNSIIIRCPTIMDEGRLGLLGILFAFIDEGRKIWIVGDGNNKYQFIYAKDLVAACQKAIVYPHTEIFNIGADDVKSFNEVYEYVIRYSKSKSRLVHLPRIPCIWAMKLCFALGISPLGPYQYKMIASNFQFDTSKIKNELNWKPTKNNEEMLLTAYKYYHDHKDEIVARKDVSAHSSVADMGIIRLVKWLS